MNLEKDPPLQFILMAIECIIPDIITHMVIKMQLKTRGWSDHDLVHQKGTSDLEAQ